MSNGIEQIENLINLRRQYNLPRRYVAHRLGVCLTTIYRWERGHMIPTPGHQSAIKTYVSRFHSERARSGGVNV